MAGVFKLYIIAVISSLVVFGLMGPEFENVKESWFLIMLFTDIPKVTFDLIVWKSIFLIKNSRVNVKDL